MTSQTNNMSPATLKAGRRATSTSRKHKSFRCCHIGILFLCLLGGQGVSARVQVQNGLTDISFQKFETKVGAEKFTAVVLDKAVEKSVETFGKSAIEKASQTLVQEATKACTRSSQCTQTFVEIGTRHTVKQAVKKSLQEAATQTVEASWKETAKKFGEYAGPAVSAGFTAYEVVGDLKEGNTANAVVSTTTGVASYYAALQAGGYCASSTIYLGPWVSGGAGLLCSTATAIGVQLVGNELKTDGVSVSSSSQDNSKTDTGSESSSKVIPDITTETTADTNEGTKVGTKRKREEEKDCYQQVFDLRRQDHDFAQAETEYERLKTSGQDMTMGMISFMVNGYLRNDQVLMPSGKAVKVLEGLKHCVGLPKRTNRDWYEFMSQDGMHDGNLLFGNHPQRQAIRADQSVRAQKIVEHMRATGQRTLRTMDGHGRFVYSFLQEIDAAGEDMNEWTLELFDLDPHVVNWHRLFLPTSTRNERRNILECPDDDEFHAQTLIYMNFCSLGDAVPAVRESIEEFYDSEREVFISWSVRNVGRHTDAGSLKKYIKRRGEKISNRGSFVTYMLKLKAEVQEEQRMKEEERQRRNDEWRRKVKPRERTSRNRGSSTSSKVRSALDRLKQDRERRERR